MHMSFISVLLIMLLVSAQLAIYYAAALCVPLAAHMLRPLIGWLCGVVRATVHTTCIMGALVSRSFRIGVKIIADLTFKSVISTPNQRMEERHILLRIIFTTISEGLLPKYYFICFFICHSLL